MMDDAIGPSLPKNKQNNVNEEDCIFGPKAPDASHKKSESLLGPSLPTKSAAHPVSPLVDSKEVDIGPGLPPHLMQAHSTKDDHDDGIFGPALPPKRNPSSKSDNRVLGPQLPPGFQHQDSDEDAHDQVIGPLPPSHDIEEENKMSIARDFEMRARKMKNKLEGKDEPEKLEREEWMTELPPVLQGNFGMGPRQFRARAVEVGDRSGWTDTPADKLKKAQVKDKDKPEKKNVKKTDTHVLERDAKLAMQMKDYEESAKQESLMSMHEKKRKRKLKEDEESGAANIRRPFDREIDLQAGRFDEAAKKRMLKKSEGLASRFSHGETSGTFL